MAMSLPPPDDEMAEMHEINVTPFIDVMLVLLIVFMIAAPLATVDVAVDLPVATAEPAVRPDTPLFVTLRKDSSVAVGERSVRMETLVSALQDASGGDRGQRVFVRADRLVEYGALMDLLNVLRDAGYLKVALVGLQDEAAS